MCCLEERGELFLDDTGLYLPIGGGSIRIGSGRFLYVSVRARLLLRLLVLLVDLLCRDFFDREDCLDLPRLGLPM
jgi:hypothetical protein